MQSTKIIKSTVRNRIEKQSKSEGSLCWSCSSCVTECPVNIATGRLQPMKLIRMASLGLYDELLHLPEIWYCLGCTRCNRVCPNTVKPADLILYLRREALRTELLSAQQFEEYGQLFPKLHKARWHLAAYCKNGYYSSASMIGGEKWFDKPVKKSANKIVIKNEETRIEKIKEITGADVPSPCFTCRECSSACPVSSGIQIFDPVKIFRLVNLGLLWEVLNLPDIWLCISCGRCTDACSQLVKGHMIIKHLQGIAMCKGAINSEFIRRFEKGSRPLYHCFLDQIDLLLGLR